MSRIHEALKKAAQERSEQLADNSTAGAVDLSAEGLTGSLLTDRRVPLSLEDATVASNDDGSGFLRFQKYVSKCPRPEWKIDPNGNVFSPQSSLPHGAERFRTLRSRLYQIASTQPIRKILVTSTLPAEGKTFIAANLAQSFVRQPNRSVLLIDADLRAARLHIPFGAPTTPGLSEYLRGDVDKSQVIQVGPDGNLCLIPCGGQVANPSELLHSERMRNLLDRMAQIFDWVILDSPPALAVHDASILADMCDGVLYVVRAGTTDFAMAERAVAEFREKNLLGVVLNRVEKSDTYGEYYYNYSADAATESVTRS